MDLLQDNELVYEARRAWSAGDIDAARMWYQKAAYGFRKLSPKENEQLRQEVADFTSEDPVFMAAWRNMRDELATRPGLLQSDIGKLIGDDRELFNYAMYFAEVNGQLVRVKSGRSYKLYLPGQQPE